MSAEEDEPPLRRWTSGPAPRAAIARASWLLQNYPRIPADLDAQLLKEAVRRLGELRDRFNLRVELRAAFWDGISEAAAGTAAETVPGSEGTTAAS